VSPSIHVLDPLTDPRWDDLVARHPRASVFHTQGWLESLKQSYGYEPFALTTTGAGPLDDGLVFCRVRTWAARRMVSLPFSDHCEPLVETPSGLAAMVEWLDFERRDGGWRSFELRPCTPIGGRPAGLAETQRFMLHTLDLRRPAAEIFKRFHSSNAQRAIRRAEREGIEYDAGRSRAHLEEFFGLLRMARRRHGLPPQPLEWFRQLLASFGERLTIHLARHQGVAVAGILTLTSRSTMVYKYGGSDSAHHARGGMPFLFWRAIQQAQAAGIEVLDLGRSDLDQAGLIAFKDHLGAVRSDLTYVGIPGHPSGGSRVSVLSRAARRVAATW